jgi:hypothetical protein
MPFCWKVGAAGAGAAVCCVMQFYSCADRQRTDDDDDMRVVHDTCRAYDAVMHCSADGL